MTILHDAHTALLSGLTTYHPNHSQEIMCKDENGCNVTVEPINADMETYIVRHYFDHDGYCGCDYQGRHQPRQPYIPLDIEGEYHAPDGPYRPNKSFMVGVGAQPSSPHKNWYGNGQLKYEHLYQAGKLHGIGKGWYKSGELRFEEPYQEGKAHGVCKGWHLNGQLCHETSYQEGELHGMHKRWRENGQLSYEELYQ